jgi:hypothetical protein
MYIRECLTAVKLRKIIHKESVSLHWLETTILRRLNMASRVTISSSLDFEIDFNLRFQKGGQIVIPAYSLPVHIIYFGTFIFPLALRSHDVTVSNNSGPTYVYLSVYFVSNKRP